MLDTFGNINNNFQFGAFDTFGNVTTLPTIESNVGFGDFSSGQAIVGNTDINMSNGFEGLQYQEGGFGTFGNEGIVNYGESTPISVDNVISSDFGVSTQVVGESFPLQYGELSSEIANNDAFPISTQVISEPFPAANVFKTSVPIPNTSTTQVVPYSVTDSFAKSIPIETTSTTQAFSYPVETSSFDTSMPIPTTSQLKSYHIQ